MNGTVVAYLGNGNGTFTLTSTTPTPSSGYLALGDFNRDGKLDFATSGNLIALGNGDGTFQAPTDIVADPPSSGYSGIAAGDINNDGWTDLVLTNFAVPYNNTFGLLNNHQGGFAQVPTNFGELTAQPILADLTGNGILDLILEEPAGGEAVVYFGNWKGAFTLQVSLAGPITNTPGINLVADVNGDGIPDIWKSTSAKGAAPTPHHSVSGTGPSPGSVLVENLHGQLPKLDLPDIVVPDFSAAVMVLPNLTK